MLLSSRFSKLQKSISSLIYISIFWFVLLFLCIYFFANIANIGETPVLLPVLIIACLCLAINLVLQYYKLSNISLRYTFLFFLLWTTYISLKITLGSDDGLYVLRSFWVSTTGGCLIYYLIGCCVQSSLIQINILTKNSNKLFQFNNSFGLAYFVISLIISLICLFDFLSHIRSDIFLIDNNIGMYQRPGMFMTMNFILYSLAYTHIKNQNSISNTILNIIYCAFAIICALTSQAFGSNNAFVMIMGIFFVTTSLNLYLKKIIKKTIYYKLKYVLNKELSLYKYIIFISKNMILFISVMFIMITIFKESLPPLRIFSFNKEEGYSSFDSRIRIFNNNFIDDFSINPVLGYMNRKSYIHSFIISTITHCGLLGFSLFLLFIIQGMIDSFKENNKTIYHINSLSNKKLSMIIGIYTLFIASLATFFSWAPVWLTFGLNYPFFKTKDIKLK